jgi:hypothetical protein
MEGKLMFKKYMHVEKYDNDEVQGIEMGECWIFSKVDGTNASIWKENGELKAGSRKRELTLDADNAGFYAWVLNGPQHENLKAFFNEYPNVRLFGEFLVPHALRTYRADAWNRFYIFDVYNDEKEQYLHYKEYQPMLEEFNLDYIPPICTAKNVTYDNLLHEVQNNTFLIEEGKGCGEGIVIKNYAFQNRFGRTVWAKIITNEFKEKHSKAQPTSKKFKEWVEQKLVDEYVTEHLVTKTYAKIVNECQGWNSKYIPRLLSTVYHDFVTEELWNAIKKHKNPTIDFKRLNQLTVLKIKELKPELF